jgi:hypothetical protein
MEGVSVAGASPKRTDLTETRKAAGVELEQSSGAGVDFETK